MTRPTISSTGPSVADESRSKDPFADDVAGHGLARIGDAFDFEAQHGQALADLVQRRIGV